MDINFFLDHSSIHKMLNEIGKFLKIIKIFEKKKEKDNTDKYLIFEMWKGNIGNTFKKLILENKFDATWLSLAPQCNNYKIFEIFLYLLFLKLE